MDRSEWEERCSKVLLGRLVVSAFSACICIWATHVPRKVSDDEPSSVTGRLAALRGARRQSVQPLLQHARQQGTLVRVPVQLWQGLERSGMGGQYDVCCRSACVFIARLIFCHAPVLLSPSTGYLNSAFSSTLRIRFHKTAFVRSVGRPVSTNVLIASGSLSLRPAPEPDPSAAPLASLRGRFASRVSADCVLRSSIEGCCQRRAPAR